MAAPAYATDLVDITTSFSANWSLITEGGGGANSLTAPETDDFIQGTECVSRSPFSSSIRGIIYNATHTITADNAVFFWWKADVAAALDTLAGGGISVVIGSGTTDYRLYSVAGSDTYKKGGWRCSPIDRAYATASRTRGTPTGTLAYWGASFDVPSTGPSKGFPFKVDMIRRGRNVEITAGDSGDPANFAKLTAYSDADTRRWGIVEAAVVDGKVVGLVQRGRVYWGTASAACYSRVSNKQLVFSDTLGFTVTGFTQLIFSHASSNIVWTGVSIVSLDTLNQGIITVNNNAPVSLLNCVIQDINTTSDGGTNSVWNGTAWIGCKAITSAGGSFLNCTVEGYTGTANTSAFVYNIAANPGGEIDGMNFTAHASTLSHAIEFGLSSPTTIDLNGIDFSGYSASNNVNNSMLHIKRTSGTVTINLSGCTVNGGAGTITYRTDGATVVIVSSNTLELTGLKNPTEVRVYDAGTTTEVAGQEDVISGTFSTSIDAATYPNVDVSLISLGYQIARLQSVSMATDRSIPVSQVIDRQYSNPA